MKLRNWLATLAVIVVAGCDRAPAPQQPATSAPQDKVAARAPAETGADAPASPGAPAGANSAASNKGGLPDETIDETAARRTAAEVYGLLTDSTVDVISAEDLGYTWKVIFRLRGREGTPDQTAYVTKDGRWITDQLLDVSEYTDRLHREKRFAECLANKELRIFVAPGDPTSQKMIDAVGSYAHRVAVDCRSNPTSCQNLGIELLPTTQLGQIKESGAKDRAWLENLSGCKY